MRELLDLLRGRECVEWIDSVMEKLKDEELKTVSIAFTNRDLWRLSQALAVADYSFYTAIIDNKDDEEYVDMLERACGEFRDLRLIIDKVKQ